MDDASAYEMVLKSFTMSAFLQAQGKLGDATVLHLHGSTRFGYHDSDEGRLRDIVKYPTSGAALASVKSALAQPDAGRGDITRAGTVYANSPIISGVQKADKLMLAPVPFGYYYHTAISELLRRDHALVIGYGCGDPHINAWVKEAAAVHGNRYRLAFVTHVSPKRRGPYTSASISSISNFLRSVDDNAFNWNSIGPEVMLYGDRLCVVRSGFPMAADVLEVVLNFLKS